MAFVRRSDFTPEQLAELDKKTQEILENMATLTDIFGGGGANAPFAKLQQPGDKIVGVITEEPDTTVPVYQFVEGNKGRGPQKFYVQLQDGSWKVLAEGTFDKDNLTHRPVTKIVVKLRDKDGKDWRIDFNTKQEKEALKQEMISTGLSLEPGVTIGKQVTARSGNNKTVAVKLVAAS